MPRLSTAFLGALTLAALLLTTILTTSHVNERSQLEGAARASAELIAKTSAGQISGAFGDLMRIAELLSEDLSSGALPYDRIRQRLFEIVGERPDIDGIAVTFAPYAYDPGVRLYQTYVYRQDDGSHANLDGATYDYSAPPDDDPATPDTSWFYNTINGGAGWLEPFFAAGAKKVLVEYGIPFYSTSEPLRDEPAGIVTIDYSLEDVRSLLAELELGATGYGLVISSRGTFLAHPVVDFVARRTLFEIVPDDDRLSKTARAAIGGRSGFVESRDPVTEQVTWTYFEPIGSTGWAVGIVLNQSEFAPDSLQTIREQMTIALSAGLFAYLLISTIFHVDRYRITGAWASAMVFSVLCVVLIVISWILAHNVTARTGTTITSQTQLERYLENEVRLVDPTERPVEIPTGIEIQALQFPDATSIVVNGYVWQRYPLDSNVEQGVTFPQRVGVEGTIEEVRRDTTDGFEVVVWYFGLSFSQGFDSTRFPLDFRDIVLRMEPADQRANVVLVPDLASYSLINPRLLPGIDPGAVLNNWSIASSAFRYIKRTNTVSLGLSTPSESVPELEFSVRVQRAFIGPFIAYVLPGLIAAAMSFAYLVSGREPGKSDEIPNVLNYAAALFFVVAVIHAGLRDQVAAVGITYLEHIYILLYVAIIATAVNIFAAAKYPDHPIIRWRNNLLPKVLFWPVFSGVLLVTSVITFIYT